ncbi:MAG: hypothetical protein U0414_01470 [Polyangiaceae bacterium]
MGLSARLVRPWSAAFAVLSSVSVLVCARADAAPDADAKKRAHEAFERGNQQSERGDYEAAAHSFAEADSLSPNKIALESALDTSILANDVPLGAELLERAKRDDTLSKDLMKRAHAAFDGRAGRVEIRCIAACTAKIDGAPIEGGAAWAKVGPHHVSIKEGDFSLDKDIEVSATTPLKLEVDRTPKPVEPVAPPAPEPPPSTRLLHPAFAFVGIGLTAGLVAGTIGSGVDAMNIHDAFVAAPIDQKPALAEDGIAAQTRTNVLIGVSCGVGALTLALGLLAVPWGGGEKKKEPVTFEIGPARASLRATF